MLEYDALIDCTYAASLDPALWPVALARLSDDLGAAKFRVSAQSLPGDRGGFTFSHGFPIDTGAICRTGGHDREGLWTRRLVERGLASAGSVALDTYLATDDELSTTRTRSSRRPRAAATGASATRVSERATRADGRDDVAPFSSHAVASLREAA